MVLVFVHAIGAAFAGFVRSAAQLTVACCSRMRGCFERRCCSSFVPAPLDIALWTFAALIHPSGSLLLLNLRLFMLRLHTKLRRIKVASIGGLRDSGVAATSIVELDSWAEGLAMVLIPYLLCYTPSVILTIWILLGQHREASTPQGQNELLEALPGSRHRVTPWFDSWLFETRPELREHIAIPAMGLLLPILAISCHVAASRRQFDDTFIMVPRFISMMARVALCCVAVCAACLAGSRPERLFVVCQPALLVHAIVPVAVWCRCGGRACQGTVKVE